MAQFRAEDVSAEAIGEQVIIGLRQMAAELEEGALITRPEPSPSARAGIAAEASRRQEARHEVVHP